MTILPQLKEIGWVYSTRTDPVDDGWDAIAARIELDPDQFSTEVLTGIETFSHLEVLYLFHRAGAPSVAAARHPRGRTDWPAVGIFAQRAKARPNLIGTTICTLEKVDGLTLFVRGLDAIDGSPVLDIKPVMSGFLPRGDFREPDWAKALMKSYW